ncbi:MAG: M12 family metallo-peptidase [Archangium sp.]|nr:M12 family metallo-peptidase [Archangium sp.]
MWRLAAVLVLCACVKTERDYQLEHARSLTPKALGQPASSSSTAPRLAPQPPRVFTVRAWVDLDYQAQVLHWNERITSQLARASQVAKAALNVELKLVAIESWNHRSERAPLEAHLAALEKEDGATDVDLALGFVSSLEIFTESQEQLGLARLEGRHAVLRAMDNAPEHQAITRVFTRLDETERDALYRERKLHKEITLVLHEWGHVLGAPHDTAGDSLLNPAYAVQRTRFAPMTAALLARSLELRDAKVDRKTWAKELHTFIRAAPEGSWSLQDLEGTLADLERVMRGEDAQAAAATSQKDRALFNGVLRLVERGKHQEALDAVLPLVAREPAVPGAHSLACQLSGLISLGAPETMSRCRDAVALTPGDGPALLMLAQAQAATKAFAPGRVTFIAAREQLLSSPAVSVETSAALGSVARSLGFVTWAEQSSARAPGRTAAEQVVEWAARKRRWFGLPAGVSSPSPEAEPDYVDRFIQVQNELGANQLARAEASVAALEKSFPELPGPMTLRCEVSLRRRANGKAIAACERAVAAYPDSLQAHYLLGVMHSMAGQHRKAVEHLEQVVAGDPTVDDAWQRLATSYGALGDRTRRERAIKRE